MHAETASKVQREFVAKFEDVLREWTKDRKTIALLTLGLSEEEIDRAAKGQARLICSFNGTALKRALADLCGDVRILVA
jgi:hypothetical protein